MERNEFDQEFVKKTSEELSKVSSLVLEEKKVSEEAQEALVEMLKEMVHRMKAEIESEKKERETTEDTLLTLLEDTCTKINLKAQGSP